jgi:ELWxxDGT repeat protein
MKKISLYNVFSIVIVNFLFQTFSFAQQVPISIFPTPIVSLNYPLQDNDQYVDFSGNLYFKVSGFTHTDWELWRTNGDLNGTQKIKTLYRGTTSCNSSNNPILTATKSKLFFSSFDSTAGEELWISDGTAAGTKLLKDINLGPATSCLGSFTAKGDTLFFVADDGIHGSELWMSDGTAAGTKMVLDIDSVPVSGNGLNVSFPLTIINGTLYFYANNFYNGWELWRSDGSLAGTYMIKDINPGSGGSGWFYDKMFQVGNNFYFVANDGIHGMEPWISDGTSAGTNLVKDVNPGSSASNPIGFMNNIGDSLVYFRANDGLYGTEFWRSNGTLAGTYMLKDFNIGPGNGYFSPLFEFNNGYYISADFTNTGSGWKLYKTDTLLTAFTVVKNINAGAAFYYQNSIVFGNKFYFPADDGTHGNELWMSDGTSAGTNMVKDIHLTGSSNPSRFTIANSKLFFNAWVQTSSNSGSLYKLDTCQAIVISGSTDSATGSININVTGGVQPYFSYSWSNGATTQNVSGLSNGTYTVTVWDNAGCIAGNSFFVNSTVGINEADQKINKIFIAPNPFCSQTTLRTDFPLTNATIEVDNCFGQTVAQMKNLSGQTITFNRDNLPSGLYFVRLTADNKTIAVDKLVITDK